MSQFLDLGDHTGRAVKIEQGGWSLVEKANVHFRRPAGMLPFPVPSRDGSIELLRPFVNLLDADFRLLVAWMAAALSPEGPYPVLVLTGEHGSAKSTSARIVRELIDPQAAPLLGEPSGARDLMVTATNGWLLVYDNISTLPNWLSDNLCRLASGGGLAMRALYSNEDRNTLYAQRPIILNGIDHFVRKNDLADRSIFLRMASITPESAARRASFGGPSARFSRRFWLGFSTLSPAGCGASDGAPGAAADGGFRAIRRGRGPRTGLGEGTFVAAYDENRREATASSLEDSLLGTEILDLVEMGDGYLDWTASPTDMLQDFTQQVGKRVAASSRWPKTPTMLASELSRLRLSCGSMGCR